MTEKTKKTLAIEISDTVARGIKASAALAGVAISSYCETVFQQHLDKNKPDVSRAS